MEKVGAASYYFSMPLMRDSCPGAQYGKAGKPSRAYTKGLDCFQPKGSTACLTCRPTGVSLWNQTASWRMAPHLCGCSSHRLDCLVVTVLLLFGCQSTSSFPFRPCCVIIIANKTKDVNLKVSIRKMRFFTLRQDPEVRACFPKWGCMC